MPVHSEAHKSKGSKKDKASKTRGQRMRHGKKGRATRSSRAIVSNYEEKLRKGEHVGAMFLAEVTSAPGGGHFHVQGVTSREKVMAHVTPTLSVKSAKYGNSSDEFSIRVGSHVLVDGNIIRAVVPRERLSALKEEEESNSNSLFSRSSGSTHSSKSAHSSKSLNLTRKNKRAPKVPTNDD